VNREVDKLRKGLVLKVTIKFETLRKILRKILRRL